jgi:hypothetical protein
VTVPLPAAARLVLLTRIGCHLCDDARAAMDRVAAVSGERWAEVDLDADRELEAEYGLRIPVLLLDGAEHDYWRIDEPGLLRALAGPTG